MKKLLSLLLAASMCVVLLAACGSNGSADASKGAASSAPAASAAASGDKADGDAAEVKTIESGKLIMATNAQFPPYEMVADGDGVNGTGFEGIDIEIATAIAEKLGLELQVDDMDFDAALTAVQQGKCDLVLAGLTYTDERAQLMTFSDSYAQGVQAIIVKEGSAIASPDDLANAAMIGTQRGTTGYLYCTDDFGEDHVAAYDSGAAAVQALLNGQVDAVVIDKMPAETFAAENDGLKVLDTAYTTEDYCAAMNKDNEALTKEVNVVLAELKADGTLDQIVAKYINAN
ncbi:MAG: ABC transporter substrate-binding protein [Oscillospiraceae bacterium]|nr:ABC transporter substrate-binding protein [Eubacteriales bacterium]MDY2617302.1 ABC transporter substrate-binding protein [Oscillospiraceae bacterium]